MTATIGPEAVTPHNLEAERAVLGAILVHGERFPDVADCLAADDFFRDAHRRIFSAMHGLASDNQPIDGLTVKDRLAQRQELEEVGGPAYLFSLADGVSRGSNVTAYAGIIRDRAQRTRLITALRRTLEAAEDSGLETRAVLDQAEREIFAVSQQHTTGDFVGADTLEIGRAHV